MAYDNLVAKSADTFSFSGFGMFKVESINQETGLYEAHLIAQIVAEFLFVGYSMYYLTPNKNVQNSFAASNLINSQI